MTSEGNNVNVDRRPPLQRGLMMEFQLQNFQPYNNLLQDWSLPMFPKNLYVSFGFTPGNIEILEKQN